MSEDFTPPGQITFEEELRRYSRAVPFIPFDIITSSGAAYQVTDSDQIALGPNTIVVVLPRTGVQMIRRSLITAVHLHEPVV